MLTDARALLIRCEADLRNLLSKAAAAGDYDSIVQISALAKEVGALVRNQPERNGSSPAAAPEPKKKKSKAKEKGKDYPRFQRRGGYLVKIGWSKRDRSEYEHKAPWSVAQPILEALGGLGADGRVFQISELLPLTNAEQEVEIPDYQVYLMFAWLKAVNLIDKHGRQGYSMPNPSTLAVDMNAAWQQLPTKR